MISAVLSSFGSQRLSTDKTEGVKNWESMHDELGEKGESTRFQCVGVFHNHTSPCLKLKFGKPTRTESG